MKITLLGTSHGNPTMTRLQSSALIEICGHRYLIDAGEGTNATLTRMGVCREEIDAIFITHMHIDHAAGLPQILAQACKYRARNPDLDPAVLLPDQKAVDALRIWMKYNSIEESMLKNISSYNTGTFYDDGFLKAEAFPTSHMIWSKSAVTDKSYGFRITAGGNQVFFTGDLSHNFSDFPFEAASGCDTLISELVHFSPEDAYNRIKGMQIKRLVFTHIGDLWQTPEGEKHVLDLFADAGFPVTMGYDGFSFETGR